MRYNQYLYFSPKKLSEYNLNILNEMYFGKSPRIKVLEKLMMLYFDSFYHEITEDELEPFVRIIMQSEKYLNFKNLETGKEVKNNSVLDAANNPKITWKNMLYKALFYSSIRNNKFLTDIQKKMIAILENLISIIFGIASVRIVFNSNFDKRYNMATVPTFLDFFTYPKRTSDGRLLIKDNDGKFLDYDYIKKNIIVKNTGITIDMTKCKLSIVIFFSKIMQDAMHPKLAMSHLLHEIGHFFSYLLLPINKYLLQKFNIEKGGHLLKDKYLSTKEIDKVLQDIKDSIKDSGIISKNEIKFYEKLAKDNKSEVIKKIAGRINEKFADQFVSLYGYGPDLTRSFYSFDSYKIYGLGTDNDKLSDTSKTDKSNTKQRYSLLKNSNNFKNIDVHPLNYDRMQSQMIQLKAELDNPRLSPSKRKQIKADIQEIQQLLHFYNKNVTTYGIPIDMPNSDFTTIDDAIKKMIINEILEEIANVRDSTHSIKDIMKKSNEKIESWKLSLNSLKNKKSKSLSDIKNINKIEEQIDLLTNDIKTYKSTITDNEDKIEFLQNIIVSIQTNKNIPQFIKDEMERRRYEIEKYHEDEPLIHAKNKRLYKGKDIELRTGPKKKSKNWMYEKDSYIDPYDISTEINKLYDNSKMRHVKTIFDDNTWLSIPAQKEFEKLFDLMQNGNKINNKDIDSFIELKYKYHMEKPFFKHKKIQPAIKEIFEQERDDLKQHISNYIEKQNIMLRNQSKLSSQGRMAQIKSETYLLKIKSTILKIAETDNLEKNMKKLKQIIFGGK